LSDCIYYNESLEPLIETLNVLVKPSTKIILAQELRESKKQIELIKDFLKQIQATITFREVPQQDQHPHYQCNEIMLFSGVRKV